MNSEDKNYVLVTEYFHPDTASTGQLMTDLAVGLKERGLNVTVYTGQPNYHSGKNKKQPRISTHKNVLVKRICAPQFRQSSLSRRLFNWFIFTGWMFAALLVSQADEERELIVLSNPPMLPPAMWLVCKLRGWDYTYIVHDLYPDQPIELGYIKQGRIIEKVWTWFNARSFQDAKHIVALGPVMRNRITENTGSNFDPEKITIIHNWEDENFIEPMPKEKNWFSKEHDLVEPFTILYSGNIGEFHDLETVVEAASTFEGENVRFLIIGEGDNKENIVSLAEDLRIRGDTVRFLSYQPWDDLPYSLTSADVSVITVNEGFEGVCVSSKLYSAMAAGMPVLGITQPYDDEARLIDAFDAGIHVPQEDVEGVVDAVRTWKENPKLVENQGTNARQAFEQRFTKDQSIDRYYKLLTEDDVPGQAMQAPQKPCRDELRGDL